MDEHLVPFIAAGGCFTSVSCTFLCLLQRTTSPSLQQRCSGMAGCSSLVSGWLRARLCDTGSLEVIPVRQSGTPADVERFLFPWQGLEILPSFLTQGLAR